MLAAVGRQEVDDAAFRLCRATVDQGKSIIAINIGKTRADDLLTMKLETSCEQLLPRLTEQLIR